MHVGATLAVLEWKKLVANKKMTEKPHGIKMGIVVGAGCVILKQCFKCFMRTGFQQNKQHTAKMVFDQPAAQTVNKQKLLGIVTASTGP